MTDVGVVQQQAAPVPAAAAPTPDPMIVIAPMIRQAIAEAQQQTLTPANVIADAKPFLMSKTLWGVVMTAVATELQQLGYHFAPADQAALINDIMSFFQLAGLVLATIGRITATKGLK